MPALRLALAFTLAVFGPRAMVEEAARHFGQDPIISARVVGLESDWDPQAIGDDGRAVGLWQWHLGSWEFVREHMGEPTTDLRSDPVESTITAMYAWDMGLARWWTGYRVATREVQQRSGER